MVGDKSEGECQFLCFYSALQQRGVRDIAVSQGLGCWEAWRRILRWEIHRWQNWWGSTLAFLPTRTPEVASSIGCFFLLFFFSSFNDLVSFPCLGFVFCAIGDSVVGRGIRLSDKIWSFFCCGLFCCMESKEWIFKILTAEMLLASSCLNNGSVLWPCYNDSCFKPNTW